MFSHEAMSGLFVEKALMTCSLLVKKPLSMGGLLAFVGGTLVEESLARIGLLALTSGFLVEMALVGRCLEAVVLVLPQFVNRPLPILVGAFHAGASPKKNEPPGQFWMQQAGGLLVFAKCSLEPFRVANGMTNIARGIEFLIIVKHPVRGTWGRLRPLV